jgi:MoxR-like ATPase
MIIRFKEVEEAYLKTLFFFIPKAEYDLISGTKTIITDSEMKKANKAGFLSYLGVKVSVDLIEENPTEESLLFGSEYLKLSDHLASSFIHSKDVIDSLYPAVCLNKNVLLYGRGGHGKSEMSIAFMDKALGLGLINEAPFVQAFGEGLTEEALFGGFEMKKFMDSGEYEYLVENSFMNHEIVIFEELFDAPAQVLLSLKDIMTSGYFRKGNQLFKIKTKVIIGLTNKSKDDFSEDESLEAFVQRFPITKKIEWETYTKVDFTNLFMKRFDDSFYKKHKSKLLDLANIIELNNVAGTGFVSPRTAVAAAQLYAFGSSLDLISDIDSDITKKYFKENKEDVISKDAWIIINKATDYFAIIQESCKSIDGDESEDEILSMLSGDDTNFGIEKVLTQKDKDVVSLAINKISFLRNYLSSASIPSALYSNRDNLLISADEFRRKLTKIIN